MKYKILLLILFLPLIAYPATHDTDYLVPHNTFEGRIICGANFTQLDGDTYAGYHKAGLNAGAMVYVHFTQSFGISLEMTYSQKGVRGGTVKESYAWGTYFDKYYLNLNYAETALMLHLDTYIIDYEAGISYALLISSKEWAEADMPQVFDPYLTRFNNDDIEYIAGASVRLSKRWSINMRYQYSITPVRPWDRVLPRYGNGNNQRNEVVALRLLFSIL